MTEHTTARRTRLMAVAVGWLALVPIAGNWCYKEFLSPRPFWVHFYDVETLYYHSGREILQGQAPHNVDNPGSPVQLLSAMLLRVTGDHPAAIERFLSWAHLLAFGATVGAVALLCMTLFAETTAPLLVAGVWTYFIAGHSLEYNNVWGPESLTFAVGSLALASIWAAARSQWRRNWLVASGAAVGLCCSLKLTFLAWAPALGLAVAITGEGGLGKRVRDVSLVWVGVAVGFGLLTSLAGGGHERMFAWLQRLATHAGQYGAGESGLPDLWTVLGNWWDAVVTAKGWHLWAAVCVLLAGLGCWRHRAVGAALSVQAKSFVVFGLAGMAFSYVLVSRFFAPRYLLPSALATVCLFQVAASLDALRRSRKASALVVGLAGVLLGRHLAADIATHHQRTTAGWAQHLTAEQVLRSASPKRQPVVLFSFRFPHPALALRLDAYDPDYFRRVEALYPLAGHYDVWRDEVHLPAGQQGWDFLIVPEDDLEEFPEPVGAVVGRSDHFLVVRSSEDGT